MGVLRKPQGLTILVSGMVAADPHHGGATWAVLQYVLGLERLGHRVYVVEPVPPDRLRPAGVPVGQSINAEYFDAVAARFGFRDRAALLVAGTRDTIGMPYDALLRVAREADVLLNISGMLTDQALTNAVPCRVYLDLDPAFNQLWHEAEGLDMRFAGHTHFVTVGQGIGSDDCDVPTCGLAWIPTRPPVVLAHWPASPPAACEPLTTVANWRGYGSIEYKGKSYGQKAHSLRRFVSLPRLTRERFLLALAIDPGEVADLEALDANGWALADPAVVASTPDRYARFIAASKAEFGVAKSGYALSRCGWFSDRSACYLATGRPVVAQDTGFRRYLPTGEGLFAFDTIEDAIGSLAALAADYPRHCRAARELACDVFDSDRVLSALLDRVGAPA
jgi:hypothetical protein